MATFPGSEAPAIVLTTPFFIARTFWAVKSVT